MQTLLTVTEACEIASQISKRAITESNINYLIQYGRIDKVNQGNGIFVILEQLSEYYSSYLGKREIEWKNKLSNDLNWSLSFDTYKESETTKHVHRLHPYKGKYIPQLVEYFLDEHIDEFKKTVYFHKNDIILDPFCGSGTTLVQANELGMHSIGIDISAFNSLISNCKIQTYDLNYLKRVIERITELLDEFEKNTNIATFEKTLLEELNIYNSEYFPSPDFKKQVYNNEINEKEYGNDRANSFLPIFQSLTEKHEISYDCQATTFLKKWYYDTTYREIEYVNSLISKVNILEIKNILQVILSRTVRSCRLTTHSDLATLIEPIYTTYYCTKHKKICKPLFSILKWWKTYSKDTLNRLYEFSQLRTPTAQRCFNGDSKTINIEESILSLGGDLENRYFKNKIKGIFCSPPYVGLIDYHEQHAYAYELFGLERKDDLEIGPLASGTNLSARAKYVRDISDVLLNCKKYLEKDYEVFIVANDKNNLYPLIAEKANMIIVEQFKRPVLNRTEKDKNAYSETIFRMKEK